MTAWYRQIIVTQEPFDIGLDASGRAQCAFNFSVVKSSSDVFVEEIIALLETASVGSFDTTIFASTKANLPTDPDVVFITMIERGGAAPERTHNEIGPPAYQRPSAQLVATGKTYPLARTMARAAYDALVGVRNITVTAT